MHDLLVTLLSILKYIIVMPTLDPRIDAYIKKSRDFAQPILKHLRSLVHDGCPDIIETMKWSMPFFDYKGTVCSMASFNEHCAFGFWKHSLMEESAFPAEKTAMGSFGRIASIADLPGDETMKKLIGEAVRLNVEGIKVARIKPVGERKDLIVPDILLKAFAENDLAADTFDNFPYSKKKDYVEWINEAKTETTRNKRLATTIEWLAEGKARNWKYEKC